MHTSLNTFIANIKNNQLTRANRYSVYITAPGQIGNTELLSSLCDSVTVPGVSLATSPNKTYGESREVPYDRLFDEAQLSFYLEDSMLAKKFFDRWMKRIIDPITRNFRYYSDYVGTTTITIENLQNEIVSKIKLNECFPKAVSPVQLSYADPSIIRLNVTMSYKNWEEL